MNRTNATLKDMARQMLIGHYQAPMLAIVLTTLIPTALLLPFNYLCSGRSQYPSQAIIYYLAYFIITAIELMLGCGAKLIYLGIARHQTVTVKDMFQIFKARPDRILLGSMLYILITWIPMLPSIIYQMTAPATQTNSEAIQFWCIYEALYAGGIFLGFLLSLPFYLIFWIYADDSNCDTLQAFRRSMRMMRGGKWRIFKMEFSFIGWTLLGMLSFGIGFLWILPYTDQAITNFYLDQKHEFDVKVELSDAPGPFTPNL